MIIQSNNLFVQSSLEKVQGFLSLPQNIQHLLPQERITDFKADEQGCEFKVQGGIVIPLLLVGQNEEGILYTSGPKAPFPFSLQIVLQPLPSGIEGCLRFNGDAPAMVAMLAKNPLTALFNEMGQNLKVRMEEQG